MVVGRLLLLLLVTISTRYVAAQRVGEPLSVWQKGQLDIHHISTGQGNAALLILPDGTSLLIDAGAIDPVDWRTGKPRDIPTRPDTMRQAGEWIARYARNALRFRADPAIDYVLLTHFHDDHMGTPRHGIKRAAGGYVLSGITEVAEYISVHRVLDRGWPDYSYPQSMEADSIVANYRHFLSWQQKHNGLTVERFQAGRTDQIVSKYNSTCPVKIRNLMVNGECWTGKGTQTKHLFPDLTGLPLLQRPNENMCSAVLSIHYGDFTYFSGGDIPGVLSFGTPEWHDMETPLAAITGPIDVKLVDHHGYRDAENSVLLTALKPRVLVIPAWSTSHPAPEVLERMLSTMTYDGKRDVFTTNLLQEAKTLNKQWLAQLKSQSGHVVIRVEPGGKRYRVFVLDDTQEIAPIKAIYGFYKAKSKR
ncbi:beta-lactamase superfamily II metal-dependent hydrolase [Spirosoma oryzae]|uniref:Beta-lactamase superfamily II metal-dependent hydrolase n=2 Tax=Spirosoma oryzae TaxID=1469603 RepID=A0A2T0T0D3_9BACT|nr:beta-lactamase superfamily II metal-dependent hydrolase [Spirosoma oryzae]